MAQLYTSVLNLWWLTYDTCIFMMRRRFHPMMQRCLVSIISTCNIILRHVNSSRLYVDCGEIESIHVEWTEMTPRVYCKATGIDVRQMKKSYKSDYDTKRCQFLQRLSEWEKATLLRLPSFGFRSSSTVYTRSGGYTASIYVGAIKNKLRNVINKKKYNKHKNEKKNKPNMNVAMGNIFINKRSSCRLLRNISYKRLWLQYFFAW